MEAAPCRPGQLNRDTKFDNAGQLSRIRMPRSALIVDDSRTALTSLSRMLKAQGMHVDAVESGPEALDFLRKNTHPGVLFLDHMMPGMDGFQTLAALKSNPQTRSIPVVMYTSREGDAYMGQALAQGAVGVLRKPVEPAELVSILQGVDRLRAGATSAESAGSRVGTAVTGVIEVPADLGATPASPGTARALAAPPAVAATTGSGRVRAWLGRALVVLVLLVLASWSYQRYWQADQERAQLRAALASLERDQREQAAARQKLPAPVPPAPSPPLDRAERRALLETLEWAVNQRAGYPLNEEPLSDSRLVLVRELVNRLAIAGFTGRVSLETHVGEFCVVRDDQGGYRLPPDSTPFSRCEVLRYPPAQAEYLGRRQSPAFARFIALQAGGQVQLVTVSHGVSRPLAPYPEPANVQTAGDWNQVARLNQRVEIALLPTP